MNAELAPNPAAPEAMRDAADFGLSSRARHLPGSVFAAESRIDRALIYGSRAKGNYRPGSIIDIALDAPHMTYSDCLHFATTLDVTGGWAGQQRQLRQFVELRDQPETFSCSQTLIND